ncbi:MAG TPA: hypothetical protein VHM19_17905 [Polyangiales bacterium]|jgi:hypothetical protein|nr:hypothetical protein [Polyangiales bacterium]
MRALVSIPCFVALVLALSLAGACGDDSNKAPWEVEPAPPQPEPPPSQPVPEVKQQNPIITPEQAELMQRELAKVMPKKFGYVPEDKPATEKPDAPPSAAKAEKAETNPAATAAKKPDAPAAKPDAPAVKPEPAAPVAPAKVTMHVRQSEHVKVDVPAKLQALLDDDGRMQPWLDATMDIVNRCRDSNPSAEGTVTIMLTMHKDERPSAEPGKVPSALTGVFACAMSDFMRAKRMPLFTGPEGEKHTLRVRFVK